MKAKYFYRYWIDGWMDGQWFGLFINMASYLQRWINLKNVTSYNLLSLWICCYTDLFTSLEDKYADSLHRWDQQISSIIQSNGQNTSTMRAILSLTPPSLHPSSRPNLASRESVEGGGDGRNPTAHMSFCGRVTPAQPSFVWNAEHSPVCLLQALLWHLSMVHRGPA